MGFTEEQMRACGRDGGTRVVAPGQVPYYSDGDIDYVSDKRKALQDEDVRRAQPAVVVEREARRTARTDAAVARVNGDGLRGIPALCRPRHMPACRVPFPTRGPVDDLRATQAQALRGVEKDGRGAR